MHDLQLLLKILLLANKWTSINQSINQSVNQSINPPILLRKSSPEPWELAGKFQEMWPNQWWQKSTISLDPGPWRPCSTPSDVAPARSRPAPRRSRPGRRSENQRHPQTCRRSLHAPRTPWRLILRILHFVGNAQVSLGWRSGARRNQTIREGYRANPSALEPVGLHVSL